MPSLPSSLALTTISDNASIVAVDHRNNYVAIQTAVNALITALSGGSTGQVLQALSSNSVAYATPPSAHVFHSAAQSVTNVTPLALLFNSERFDTDTIHDTVTNNSRLTCKTAGKYLIGGNIEWPGNVTGVIRQVFIRLNGTTSIGEDLRGNNGTQVVRQIVITTYDLAVNDYVELMANQDTGGAWNVNATGNFSPEFWMVRVG